MASTFIELNAKERKALAKSNKAKQPKKGTIAFLEHAGKLTVKLQSSECLADICNGYKLLGIYVDSLAHTLTQWYGDKTNYLATRFLMQEVLGVVDTLIASKNRESEYGDGDQLQRVRVLLSTWLEDGQNW